jgi:hypothetical protein
MHKQYIFHNIWNSVLKAIRNQGELGTPGRLGVTIAQGELDPPGRLGNAFETLIWKVKCYLWYNLKGSNFHIRFFSSTTLKVARVPLGKKPCC